MCIFFVVVIFFIGTLNYQQQIEIHVCFVDMFGPLEEGRQNWPGISFYFGMVNCTAKAKKMREFIEVQS